MFNPPCVSHLHPPEGGLGPPESVSGHKSRFFATKYLNPSIFRAGHSPIQTPAPVGAQPMGLLDPLEGPCCFMSTVSLLYIGWFWKYS